MPTFAEAPPRVLSHDRAIHWLAQVAYDDDLSPIANRVAIVLAADFVCGLPTLEVGSPQLAAVLKVCEGTAKRTLDQLVDRCHLAADRRVGRKTIFRPILRGEV